VNYACRLPVTDRAELGAQLDERPRAEVAERITVSTDSPLRRSALARRVAARALRPRCARAAGFVNRVALPLATMLLGVTAHAQPDGNALLDAKNIVAVKSAPVELRAKSNGEAVVTLTIQPTWHINANPPSPDYMIATKLEVRGMAGVTPGTVVYPAAMPLKVEFDENR
jgi:hypothetical protein